jgi:ribonuclease E
MATKRMLIDASHPEETRVVVVDGNRVEDYDVEVASRRQLKGNIYLAKVTRVEPSLQAAFVDYGGNRHGFLAFNEIHPDYYQIPIADRERLLAEQAAAERAAESAEREHGGEDADTAEPIGADEDEEVERRRVRPSSRYYKIQEVIKRRQIMLVQVAKEERGNKGAALTTYLSLAGRYCVLMPNTSRGGGISRKIAGANDRKRLKKILSELEVPDGMAVIVRTAGSGRSKAEIKRDYEYLVRLWSSIREITLQSTAPTLVYEEASLIKRSIRDLYGRDIEEIIVQGEEEYRIAKEFMKLFISSHAKRVKLYEDAEKPLFQQFGVEEHLDSMHQPTVELRSGGYVVINPTEALVAIDVNSGRSTRERNIEETALRTNLEAADEIAKQLRLRDLAGLIVVDFIDMENARNQGMVERRLKEAMKNDRARVQIGRISPFGLLELSRQRLRPSLIETCFEVCPACGGNGLRRTTESTALAILRKLEEEGIKHRVSELSVAMPPAVAMYLLNQKRRSLLAIEDRYGMSVCVVEDPTLVPPDHRIERLKPLVVRPEEEVAEAEEEPEAEPTDEAAAAADGEEAAKRGRRRRPRRRRRGEEEAQPVEEVAAEADGDTEAVEEVATEETGLVAEDGTEQPGRRRRRRGKRGGRRRARMPDQPLDAETATPEMFDNAPSLAAEEDEAEADQAPMAEAADEEWAEQIEAAEPSEMAKGAAIADAEAGEGVSPQRRPRRRGGRRGRPRQADESTGVSEEPTGGDLAAEAVAATLQVHATSLALVSAFEPAPDDAHATSEARATGDTEAESAWAVSVDDERTSDEERASSAEEADEIVVVGGARPPIEEPGPHDTLQHETEEADTASVADALPSFGETDDAQGRPLAANDAETVVVGEPRPPLEGTDEERGDLGQPLQVAIAETSDTLRMIDEPEPAYHGQQSGDVQQPDDGRPLPVDPSDAEVVSAHADEARPASEEERRTEVVRVGEGGEDRGGADGPRRGWWQRLLS